MDRGERVEMDRGESGERWIGEREMALLKADLSLKEEGLQAAPGSALQLAERICHFLEEKKAADVILIDLKPVNPYFEYFLIASATGPLHLASVSRELGSRFRSHLSHSIRLATHREIASGWVTLDMIDIVIHLFLEEQRHFYNLERLWGDAEIIYPATKNQLDASGKTQSPLQ